MPEALTRAISAWRRNEGDEFLEEIYGLLYDAIERYFSDSEDQRDVMLGFISASVLCADPRTASLVTALSDGSAAIATLALIVESDLVEDEDEGEEEEGGG